MVEVIFLHVTIAFVRGGWLLVTFFIYYEGWLAPRFLILLYCIIILTLHDI